MLACEDDGDGRAVPGYVEGELRRYLECGILACGFCRARCPACGHDFLVAFSCQGRGVCPSCNARRMAETAAHLLDHVFHPCRCANGCSRCPSGRSPAHYRWAMLLARLFESLPLVCPCCCADRRIVAFMTDPRR